MSSDTPEMLQRYYEMLEANPDRPIPHEVVPYCRNWRSFCVDAWEAEDRAAATKAGMAGNNTGDQPRKEQT